MAATHVIISTHTTRHLRLTLLGVAIQGPRPATVVVSIDNDKQDIRDLCAACSHEFRMPILVTWRTSPGEVRVGQVRNNGVRALLANDQLPCHRFALASRATGAAAAGGDDWLHFLDGDSVSPQNMLATAETLRHGHDLLIGGRVLLTEQQTQSFDEAALSAGRDPVLLSKSQLTENAARHARYRRQQFFKRLGLVKAHKPKVLGANHACALGMYDKVNGYDETFLGAWREDDDFGRRVHLAGGRAKVAVQSCRVYHLWHPLNPQKRENWSELPASTPATADPWLPRAGLTNPLVQPALQVEHIAP